MSESKVTFLVPVYDTRADWLRTALTGLCAQTYPNVKVCVGDNGSTRASTCRVLQQFEEAGKIRVSWMPTDSPKGTAYALDAALAGADPDTAWFAKADSDDLFAREWIADRMKVAEALPDAVAIIYENYLMLETEPRPHIQPIILGPYDYRRLLEESYIPGPSMYRTSVYDKVPKTFVYDGYEGRANKHAEDLAHWLAITDHYHAFWNDCDPSFTWTYRFHRKGKYASDRKGVDYARTMLMARARERRGL